VLSCRLGVEMEVSPYSVLISYVSKNPGHLGYKLGLLKKGGCVALIVLIASP